MLPPTAEISSSVQTFFGFLFSLACPFPLFWSLPSVVPAGSDCGAGLAEPESEPDCEDCARQVRVAKEAKTLARASERSMKTSPSKLGGYKKYTGERNQRSPAAEAGLPKSARPSSFRTARSAALGGPMEL